MRTLPSFEIARIKLPVVTMAAIGEALRSYIKERLESDYFAELTQEEADKERMNRRFAFDLLNVYEKEPQYEVAFFAGPNTYNNKPEIRINQIRVPDRHYPTLIDVLNEEIIEYVALQGLVSMEEAEKVAEYDNAINRFLELLKKLGVEVGDDYLEKLQYE